MVIFKKLFKSNTTTKNDYPSQCYICANWKTSKCPEYNKCMGLVSRPYFKEY